MNGHIFDILIIGALIYEYFRREKEQKRVIANLKQGIYPTPVSLQKDMIGIVFIGIIVLSFIGFLIFLTFFFPMKIDIPYLVVPYGIAVILMLIVRRDIIIYKNNVR